MGNLFEISSDSGRSKYATMQQGSTADMLLYSDQTVGSQWYDTTLQKVWTWSNLNVWHVVGETTIFVKPSVEMFEGQLVVPETNNDTVEIASTIADNQVMGVVVWDVTDGDEYLEMDTWQFAWKMEVLQLVVVSLDVNSKQQKDIKKIK